jgi:pimeloyl-ACP methyl ester carboxylesterase
VSQKPQSRYATALGRDVHYMEWGIATAPVLVMWHGFARTGRDFEYSAEALSDRWRVICPDTIGCGLSEWSPAPDKEYSVHNYAQLAASLLDALGIASCKWVGTSMGGHVGMIAASGPLKGRITRMVLNDVGPDTPGSEMKRIADYMSKPPVFNKVKEAEHFMRTQYTAMGFMTDEQWLWRAETSVRRLPDGRWTLHYDPRITAELVNRPPDFNLWKEYEGVTCPVLVLRGANSKVLTEETAQQMTQRGPKAKVEILADCGHPPALNTPERVKLIHDFISG